MAATAEAKSVVLIGTRSTLWLGIGFMCPEVVAEGRGKFILGSSQEAKVLHVARTNDTMSP